MFSTTPARVWPFGLLTLILLLVLALFYDSLSAWQWQHVPLHSTMETLGGMASVLISILIFSASRTKMETYLVMVAAGFASMGILDTAHAVSSMGDAFIFLHSVASLSCGFFFASVWLTYGRPLRSRFEGVFIYFMSIFVSGTVALRALLFPADVPRVMPLFDGQFTLAAVLINTTASLFFLASVPKFHLVYRQDRHTRDLLFACLASLFGIAEMIFQFSSPWNGVWWSWHLIRLFAFLAILIFMVQQYRLNSWPGPADPGTGGPEAP